MLLGTTCCCSNKSFTFRGALSLPCQQIKLPKVWDWDLGFGTAYRGWHGEKRLVQGWAKKFVVPISVGATQLAQGRHHSFLEEQDLLFEEKLT